MTGNWIPGEVISAIRAMREMEASSRKVKHFGVRHGIFLLFPVILGLLVGIVYAEKIGEALVSAILTFIGVLVGFMIAMMVFTGRVQGTELLDFEQSQDYKNKVFYLLWSQTITLIAYVFTCVACVLWYTIDMQGPARYFMGVFIACSFFVSIIRTILLPFQIFELHYFSLTAMVEEKKRENNQRIQAAKQNLD